MELYVRLIEDGKYPQYETSLKLPDNCPGCNEPLATWLQGFGTMPATFGFTTVSDDPDDHLYRVGDIDVDLQDSDPDVDALLCNNCDRQIWPEAT